jgi:hypothetical protein
MPCRCQAGQNMWAWPVAENVTKLVCRGASTMVVAEEITEAQTADHVDLAAAEQPVFASSGRFGLEPMSGCTAQAVVVIRSGWDARTSRNDSSEVPSQSPSASQSFATSWSESAIPGRWDHGPVHRCCRRAPLTREANGRVAEAGAGSPGRCQPPAEPGCGRRGLSCQQRRAEEGRSGRRRGPQ